MPSHGKQNETKPMTTDEFLGNCGTWHNSGMHVLLPLKELCPPRCFYKDVSVNKSNVRLPYSIFFEVEHCVCLPSTHLSTWS